MVLLKLLLELINIVINRDFVWRMIGKINKRTKLIRNILVTYAPTKDLAKLYARDAVLQKIKWKPYWLGFYIQHWNVWGLIFVVSSTNDEFKSSMYANRMREILQKAENIKSSVGADSVSFGNSLPFFLYRINERKDVPEDRITAKVVALAVEPLPDYFPILQNHPLVMTKNAAIVIPEGTLSIGKKIKDLLPARRVEVIGKEDDFPGTDAVIFVAVTVWALAKYADRIPNGSIILHEVFDKIGSEILDKLKKKNCLVLQLAGVEAILTIPNFPGIWAGGIPCCAAIDTDQVTPRIRDVSNS